MFQEYTDTKIIKDMAYISVFVFFSVFVFIWYKHYGEKYAVKEKKDCPLMCGSFIEINRLAKKNSPYFWYCFQQLHPKFRTTLSEIDPTLKIPEFRLCAYICLGYTIYEIAKYTRDTTESVANHYNDVKQRLKLSCHEDLHFWLKNNVL
ncbi:hypothetical protein BAX97_08080 [Elizabethkingia meningoseptica]|uniref:hypothetical protein n=1 Tax=Elizabethkingia meningoseptica TaxID=238 RepID=UPI00099A1AAA|nr:hypothetical protein [Elizabethkingia meningoseptica]OPC27883.1 hypothetical protein BAX97_08080 [Elizabethkingia meningoseptica]